MNTFHTEYTQITTDLQTDTFNNLCRQEQMGEKIWHLEKRVMEQRVEEMMMAETLTKTRSELKGLKERWRTLSSLLDSEEYWIETVGVVSVCVCVAIGDSLPLTAAGVLSCVLTAQYRAAGEHTLRGSHQYLGHYGRCAGYS